MKKKSYRIAMVCQCSTASFSPSLFTVDFTLLTVSIFGLRTRATISSKNSQTVKCLE